MRARLAFTLIFLATFAPLRAAPLATGHYKFTARLAPVALDGRYACTLDMPDPIELDVTTAPDGTVSGTLGVWERKTPLKGRITASRRFVRLTLSGVDAQEKKVLITATLKGGKFIGTARMGRSKTSFTLDVSPTGFLDVRYEFDLAVDAKGKLSGTGTATACNHAQPVVVHGSTRETRTALSLTARRFYWRGNGPADTGGFLAQWSAAGFGAVKTDKGLHVGQ